MSARRPTIVFLTILAVAVLIRVVWLSHLAGSDIASELSVDSRFYRGLAEGILRGDPLPAGALSFNPLYPFFLVLVFKTLGDSLMVTRVLQVIIGLVTVALVHAAGGMLVPREKKGRFSGVTVALVATGMMVWYTQLALYEGMLLATSLEVFLLVASLVLCLMLDEALRDERALRVLRWNVPAWLAALLSGAACGAGALGRPNLFLLLVVGIPVWMVARNLANRRWLMPLAGFAFGAALFLAPPTLYNARHAGQFVPVTTHGGINFYIGNRPGTEGVYSPPPGMRGEQRGLLEDAHAAAEKETGRTLTDAEASDFYMQKALDGIRGDPGGWVILLGRKLLLFWNKVEVHDLPEVVYFQDSMRLFKFPFLGFGLIAPLALAGLVVFLRGGRHRALVGLYLVMAHVSVLLFYVNARYRLPVVPVMILLGAYFVAWFAHAFRGRERRDALVMMGLAVVVFFLVSNRTFVQANQGSVYVYLGTYYMNAGQKEKAEEMFAKAYQMDPNRDTSLINYGRTLLLQEKYPDAVKVLSQAYAQNPRYPHLAAYLAMALQRAGRNEDAATLAQRLLTDGDNEDKVTAYKILATAAFFRKDLAQARQLVQDGLAIAPDDPELVEMGKTLAGMQPEQK